MYPRLLCRLLLSTLLAACFILPAKAQYFDITGNRKKTKIPFRMVRNMIIIKLKINGRGPYNFIMDTGGGLMVITDPELKDSVVTTTSRTIKLMGCGDGDAYDAYVTPALYIDIPGLTSHNV